MIKNIFFDVMGVLFVVGDDTNELLVPYIQKFNQSISKQEIYERYVEASLGKITAREFWLNVGIEERDIQSVEENYLDTKLVLDSEIVDVIKELKTRGYKIGFFSNDVSEWAKYQRGKYHLDGLLDDCVISGDVKLRKPDEAIYQYVVNECGIDPKESVFIDDRIKNLIPAKKLGFHTILFDRDLNYEDAVGYDRVKSSREIIKAIEKFNLS